MTTRRGIILGGLAALLAGTTAGKRRKKHKSKNKKGKKKHNRKRRDKDRKHGKGKRRRDRDKRDKRKRKNRDKRGRDQRSADAILSATARHMYHGYRDEGTAYETLESRMARGERIEALCSTQSELGARALRRAGYKARRVGSLTRQPFTGVADGHQMLEVRLDGRWQLYDLTANAQALDGSGRGIDVSTLCDSSRRHWRFIADDRLWSQEQIDAGDVPWIVDPEGWYDRVLGTPWIIGPELYALFHDPENRERIESTYAWTRYVDAETWRQLTA